MLKLMFLKELMLIKQVIQKSVKFVTIGIFKQRVKFQPYICSKCHVLLMMPMNLSDIAILKIKNADYCCIISEISKSKAIKFLKNIDLTEKSETLYKKNDYQEQFWSWKFTSNSNLNKKMKKIKLKKNLKHMESIYKNVKKQL